MADKIEIYPESDNGIEVTDFKVDGVLVNDATIEMTLIEKQPLSPDDGSEVEDLGGSPNEVAIPCEEHNLTEGDDVYILGMDNYNDVFTVKGTRKNLDASDAIKVNKVEFNDGKSLYELAFTSGSVAPVVDDILEGDTGGATGIVVKVVVDSGSWGGGDAAGTLWLKTQDGAFQSENLDNTTQSEVNMATIAGDSTKHNSVVGDVISGVSSKASAEIVLVDLTSGSFEGDDGIGVFYVKSQVGSFSDNENVINENILDDDNCPVCVGVENAVGVAVMLPCSSHGMSVGDYFSLKGSQNFDGASIRVKGVDVSNYVLIEESYVGESFDGNENLYYPANQVVVESAYTAERLVGNEGIYKILKNAKEISLSHSGVDGYYSGVLPDNIKGLMLDSWYFLIVQMSKNTNQKMAMIDVKCVRYEGEGS